MKSNVTLTYQQIHQQNRNTHTEKEHDDCREPWDRNKWGPSPLIELLLGVDNNGAIINLSNHHDSRLYQRPPNAGKSILRELYKRRILSYFI